MIKNKIEEYKSSVYGVMSSQLYSGRDRRFIIRCKERPQRQNGIIMKIEYLHEWWNYLFINQDRRSIRLFLSKKF